VTFYVGQAVHLEATSSPVTSRANIMILYAITSTFLYRSANIQSRLQSSLILAICFTAITWVVAIGWVGFQHAHRHVSISKRSISHWSAEVIALATIFIVFFLTALGLHCYRLPTSRLRKAFRWIGGGLIITALYFSIPHPGFHIHHWIIGLLLTLFCQEDTGKSGVALISFFVQAFGLGLFVNGVAVFGFGPLFEGLPACNK